MGNQPQKYLALRVTRVKNDSPAAQAELVPFTDFIVGVMGTHPEFNLTTDLFRFLADNEGKEVTLMVFSLLTGIQRIVALMPCRTWPNADGVSGFNSRVEDLRYAETNTFRITGVKNEDLRDIIKLNSDFFLGIEEIIFRDLQELKERLAQITKCHVVVFCMDSKEVKVIPVNCAHGLGLEFFTGMLHKLSSIYQKSVLLELQKSKLREKFGDIDGEGQEEVIVYKDGQRVDVEQLMASYTKDDATDVPAIGLETSDASSMANTSSEPVPANSNARIEM
jgi:hypothetical protein